MNFKKQTNKKKTKAHHCLCLILALMSFFLDSAPFTLMNTLVTLSATKVAPNKCSLVHPSPTAETTPGFLNRFQI